MIMTFLRSRRLNSSCHASGSVQEFGTWVQSSWNGDVAWCGCSKITHGLRVGCSGRLATNSGGQLCDLLVDRGVTAYPLDAGCCRYLGGRSARLRRLVPWHCPTGTVAIPLSVHAHLPRSGFQAQIVRVHLLHQLLFRLRRLRRRRQHLRRRRRLRRRGVRGKANRNGPRLRLRLRR